jgi:3-oxoacyl-[acyl-carrier-protein] synthase-3
VTSADLDALHGRPPGTSEARSGVRERRWAGPEETSSVMAASALRGALGAAGLGTADLDAVVVAGVAPEQPMPTTAVLVLRHLGVPGGRTEAFDVNASCIGFLTGLEIATLGIAAGRWDRVAVVASEVASKGLDNDVVESSALFGDGAAAVVLGPTADGVPGEPVGATRHEQPSAVLGLRFATWPDGADHCRIEAGGTRWNAATPSPDPRAHLFRMDGPALLRQVVTRLPGFLTQLAAESGVGLDEVDVVVPHQASGVGLRYLKEKVGVPAGAVVDVLATHGNQVSASVGTALHHAVTSGRLRRGDTALLLGTGAGLSVGAVLLRY